MSDLLGKPMSEFPALHFLNAKLNYLNLKALNLYIQTQTISVADLDPDPHGSKTFARIRMRN